jgi:hypothetical protein
MLNLRRTSLRPTCLRHVFNVRWTTTLRVGEEFTCGEEFVSSSSSSRELPHSSHAPLAGTAVRPTSRCVLLSSDWFPLLSGPHNHILCTCSSPRLLSWPLSIAHVLLEICCGLDLCLLLWSCRPRKEVTMQLLPSLQKQPRALLMLYTSRASVRPSNTCLALLGVSLHTSCSMV